MNFHQQRRATVLRQGAAQPPTNSLENKRPSTSNKQESNQLEKNHQTFLEGVEYSLNVIPLHLIYNRKKHYAQELSLLLSNESQAIRRQKRYAKGRKYGNDKGQVHTSRVQSSILKSYTQSTTLEKAYNRTHILPLVAIPRRFSLPTTNPTLDCKRSRIDHDYETKNDQRNIGETVPEGARYGFVVEERLIPVSLATSSTLATEQEKLTGYI